MSKQLQHTPCHSLTMVAMLAYYMILTNFTDSDDMLQSEMVDYDKKQNEQRQNHSNALQSGPEKVTPSLMQYDFATICSRIMRFSPKCSEINW